MKEGWIFKTIKEVAEVVGGSTPKTNVEEYWGEGHFWVTPAELDGSKYIEKTARTITDKAIEKTNLSLLPVGTVLLSSRAPIGKVCITRAPMYCNQGFKNLICGEKLYNEYAYYYLKNNVSFLQSLGTGATFKEISKKVVEGITIPIPPLTEQKHIVEELDVLSSIIEKKKEQLKELDNLAQSIFYDMFGDPVTNEKGWEVKKLGDVYKLKSGDGLSAKQFIEGPYPVYGGNGISGFHNAYNKDGNFIIIGRVGVYCGNVRLVNGKFWLTDNAFQLFYDMSKQIPIFVEHMLSLLDLHQYANKAAQPVISNQTLKEINVLFPPLPLQQFFASKIEAIEQQKELIKRSIAEVETLFNSRMDYYFN